jgi:hypothetical protein
VQPTDGAGDSSAVATTVVRAWQGVPRAASLSPGVSRLAATESAAIQVSRLGEHSRIAVAMALTRPYTGVHYPSGVLAGMALGTVLGQIGRR